jgi:hypothetical protein
MTSIERPLDGTEMSATSREKSREERKSAVVAAFVEVVVSWLNTV